MLALDVGVPGTDPMWHMYHWRGSVGTRGTARPGPVGRRVYRPAPGRGNGRTPGELCGVVGLGEPLDLTSDRKPNCRLKTEGPERGGGAVWLTNVAMDPCHSTVRKNVNEMPPAR